MTSLDPGPNVYSVRLLESGILVPVGLASSPCKALAVVVSGGSWAGVLDACSLTSGP
jgi:hypothetical protein